MINMTWKNILKIEMEEARRLGRKYASKEMLQDDTDKMVRRQKEVIPRLKRIIHNIKVRGGNDNFRPNSLTHNELMSVDFWLGEVGMSPPQIKSNMGKIEIIEILEKYISDMEKAHKRHGY